MLGHLIRSKGIGAWVLILPLLVAFFLFMIFGATNLNDQYIGSLSLLISAVILWIADHGPAWQQRSQTEEKPQAQNTLMWIEVKFWAILWGLIGLILMYNLLVMEVPLIPRTTV